MGCDIHGPYLYGKRGGTYISRIAEFHWDRDYDCFAIIANVRNDDGLKPIAEPRDWPDGWRTPYGSISPDCDYNHEHFYEPEDSDCHSGSWLSTDELVEAQKRYQVHNSRPSDDMSMAIVLMRLHEQRGWTDLRILFCFDN